MSLLSSYFREYINFSPLEALNLRNVTDFFINGLNQNSIMKNSLLIPIAIVVIAVVGLAILLGGGIQPPTTTTTVTNAPTTTIATTTTTIQNTTQTASVTIQNNAFSPANLTVKVGTNVTWTNQDSVSHTVTSTTGSELNSNVMAKTKTYSHVFNTVGTYNYYCTIHTFMTGTVKVEA
jgi:plastocyanin